LKPLVNLGFAGQPLDVPRFGSRILSEDLPIILGYSLHFEGDSDFRHEAEYARAGQGRKPYSSLPYSKEPTTQEGVVGQYELWRGKLGKGIRV
jgi:hypothetical protein